MMSLLLKSDNFTELDDGLQNFEQNQIVELMLMDNWAYSAAATVLFFVGFFGFSLNLIVIILMCKDIQVSTVLQNVHHVPFSNIYLQLNLVFDQIF